MAFDILGFRDKYKGFYGDAPLEDVAKDAFIRGGYDQEHPDFDTWKQSAGIDSILEEDRKRRNPTFEDKLRSQVEQKQEPTVMGELAKGAKSGWLGANKAVGQVLQFAGKEIGIKPLEDIGQTTSEYWGNKMEPQTAAVQDIRDINSWHDFGKWAAWNIGQTGSQLATMAPFMFMGGGEIKMAKGGFTVLGDLLKGNPGAATQFGKFIGQWAKLKPVDIPIGILEGGQVLGGQLDALEKGEIDELHPIRGLASAFVATKLEELGDVLAVQKMVHGIGGQSGKLIARIAKGAVGTGLGEATEEFFQQYAEQFGIDPTNITSKEQFMQAVNGAAAGFVGGGAMGSFTGALNKSKEEGETPKNQEFNVQSKALLMNVIDLGLKSGQNPEHPFAVEDTINLIKKSQDSGILAPDDIDNLKNRYPQLRDALNGVIAENITKKVDEVVTNTLTNTTANLSDVKLLPSGQGFELKGKPYQEGVTVGEPYGDVLRPVKRKSEDNVIDAEFSTLRRIEAPKREETKLLPGQGFELSETDQDEISTLQERIQKVQNFLDKNEKHKGGKKYQQVLDRLDADKVRLAELTKGGEDNGTLRETETEIEESRARKVLTEENGVKGYRWTAAGKTGFVPIEKNHGVSGLGTSDLELSQAAQTRANWAIEDAFKEKEKPGETPDATQQQPGDIYSGKAFRVHTTNLGMDAKSALDKINFEANELGNKEEMDAAIKAAEKHGVDLSKTHPDDIVWVTRDKDTATKLYGYGEEIAEEQDIPEGSVVLSDIGEDGVLVLKGNAVKGNELPAPLSQTDAATEIVNRNTNSGKTLIDSSGLDAKEFRDVINGDTFRNHGLSGLEIPTQRKVMSSVLSSLHDPEIRDVVIKSIPVDVVDNLIGTKFPTDITLHDSSVNKLPLTISPTGSVSINRDVADALVVAVADRITEMSLRSTKKVGTLNDNVSAITTSNFHDLNISKDIGKVKQNKEKTGQDYPELQKVDSKVLTDYYNKVNPESRLIEEAKKYKTVEEFVQKTHSKFVANADKLTPAEKELADAFYKSDKEAIWNKAQETKAPETGQTKEPWQMTREEVRQTPPLYGDSTAWRKLSKSLVTGEPLSNVHKSIVKQALSEGKSVPEEVLKDYPELRNAPAKVNMAQRRQEKKAEAVKNKREAAIEKYRTKILEISPKTGNDHVDNIVKLIDSRDGVGLRQWMNGVNPRINKLFYDLTGLPARTQKEVDASLRSLDPEKWDNYIKEHKESVEKKIAERKEEWKQQDIKKEIDKKVRHEGQVLTKRELYEKLIGDGFTRILEGKRGAVPIYKLNNPNSGMSVKLDKKIEADYLRKRIEEKAKEPKNENKPIDKSAESGKIIDKEKGDEYDRINEELDTLQEVVAGSTEETRDEVVADLRGTAQKKGYSPDQVNSEAEAFANDVAEAQHLEQERRKNFPYRKKVSEMTSEERATALLTDHLTGLKNKRAYSESERKPYQASIDVDGLKYFNDTYGHDAGDSLLKKVGDAFHRAAGKVDAYHLSGDEFALEGNSPRELLDVVNKAKQLLKEESLEINGEKFTPDFSFGIAKPTPVGEGDEAIKALSDADKRMMANKKERKIKRGEKPIVPVESVTTYKTFGDYVRALGYDFPIETEKKSQHPLAEFNKRNKKKLTENGVNAKQLVQKFRDDKGQIIEKATPEPIQEEPENKVIPVKAKDEKTVVTPKEQKKYLLEKIDEALKEAPEGDLKMAQHNWKYATAKDISKWFEEDKKVYEANKDKFGTVTIEVPNDGTFTILNVKSSLEQFKKQTSKFPASVIKGSAEVKPSQPSTNPRGNRIEQEGVSYYNDFKPRKEGLIQNIGTDPQGKKVVSNFYVDGYFTDGRYIIKIDKPTKIELSERKPDIKKLMPKDKDLVPAKIVAEYHYGSADGTREAAKGHIIAEDGTELAFNAHYLDSVLTEHPNAKIYIQKKDVGMSPVVFKEGKDVVGLVMPLWEKELPTREGFLREFEETPEPKSEEKEGATADSGEELKYNKRNRIRTGIKWEDISDKNTALKVKETNKQNVYPKPDYQQMIDDGAEPLIAHIVKQVYDSIPIKPETRGIPTDEDLKLYITAVNRVMDGAIKWANDKNAIAAWAGKQAKTAGAMLGKVTSLSDLTEKDSKLLDFVYPEGYKSYLAEIRMLGGNKLLRVLQPGYEHGKKALKEVQTGWPTKQESWQRQGLRIINGNDLSTDTYTGKDNHDNPYTYAYINAKIDGRTIEIERRIFEGAESKDTPAVQEYLNSRKDFLKDKQILLDKRHKIIGYYNSLEEAQEAAREKVKRENKPTINEKGISVEQAERIGVARRLEGENISTDKLRETFGFRGVNFGNWMKGGTNETERQLHLNHAYDSFMDLAELLNVPPQALSLNGMLGVAIGAQGSGDKAAHFVPGVNEINLTRTAGAGTLAHEWAHALDHYFARMAGLEGSGEPFLTEHATQSPTRTAAEKQADGTWKKVTKNTFSENIRPEIVDLFKKIVNAMNNKEMAVTPEEQARELQTRLNKAKESVNGWLKAIRRDWFSGNEEAFDKLADRILNLDLGEGKVAASSTTYLSPVVSEIRELSKKTKGRNMPLDNIKSLQANIDHYEYLNSKKDKQHEPVMRRIDTEYSKNATKLDREKGGKPYWSQNLEKFARAFDAYISDSLEANAAKNTYLSHAGRSGETVPQGTERETINKAFSELIKEIKTRETDKGVEMYKVQEKGAYQMPTLKDVQDIFKGQEVKQFPNGAFLIRTKNGAEVIISAVDKITPSKISLSIGYSKTGISENEAIAGKYDKAMIDLVKGQADKWTLAHENIHWLEDIGVINDQEVRVLKRHISNLVNDGKWQTLNKNDIGGAEDRAEFLAQALQKEPRGLLGRIINKIQDFIDKLVNAFGIRTVRGIQRDIKTGEIYSKETNEQREARLDLEGGKLTEMSESGNQYSMTPKKGTASDIPAKESLNAGGGLYKARGLQEAIIIRQEQASLATYDLQSQREYLRGKNPPKDGNITIYRATPDGADIKAGDYVTNDLQYAKDHIKNNLGNDGKITSIKASLDDIFPADGPGEFWYAPKSIESAKTTPQAEAGKKTSWKSKAKYYGSNVKELALDNPPSKALVDAYEYGKSLREKLARGVFDEYQKKWNHPDAIFDPSDKNFFSISDLESYALRNNIDFDYAQGDDNAAINAFGRAGFRGQPIPEWRVGWRYGQIPKSERSTNFREQIAERGVSLMDLFDESFTAGGDTKLYEMFNAKKDKRIVGGYYIGRGTDGEPLLVGTKDLTKIDLPNPSRPPEVGGNKEQYQIRKQTDPPVSSDPKVLNLYLKDETDAIVQTIMNKLHPKNMSWLETMLKSPEWFDHPQIQNIVKLFMRDRNEIYHETFNDLNMTDDVDAPESTVTEAAKALRKNDPKGYERLKEILDEGDTAWKRSKNLPLSQQLKQFEDHIRKNPATTDEVIRVWKLYRQSYDKALDIMTKQLRDMIDQITEEARLKGETPDLSELKQTLKGALAEMEEWRGFYAPRLREPGNWVVQAYKEHGPLSGNKEWYRTHKGSELSAQREANRLKREGWTIHKIGEVEKIPETIYQDVNAVGTAKLIDAALEKLGKKSKLADEMVTKFNEEILREVSNAIKARGFRSTMIHRGRGNVVRGFVEDPIERHLMYINNVSGGISKARVARMAMKELLGDKVMGKQVGGIDPVKDPKAFATAEDYIQEQLRNSEPVDRIIGLAKSIATFKFLGFNLRSIAVNTTAILTTAPAAIHQYVTGGKGSMTEIFRELAKAGKDYGAVMAGKDLGNPDEAAFIADVHKKGWDDAQYTREALGEISKTHSRIWSTMMDASMYLFGKSEKWNRGTTMLAAYRLARKQGMNHDQAAEAAKTSSDKAHGVYGKSTMPMWAQGTNPAAKIGQMMYVYSKFGHNYLQMLYDMGFKQHNIKGAMFAFLSPLVLAGGAALPFKDVIFGFASVILGLLGYDDDPEKWVWDEIREHLGMGAEKVGRHGLTGAMGVDISGSLSIGVGIPKNFIDLTGAIGGVATEIAEAGENLGRGNVGRAAEHLLPTGLSNPLRAVREAGEGVSTRNNRRVWDEKGRPYVPDTGESVSRALGFRSTDQAVLSERTWEGHQQQTRFSEKRNRIYERYRAWLLGGRNREEYKKIVKEVQDFNAYIRRNKIRGESFITSQSLRNQVRRMQKPSRKERSILEE